MAALCERWAGGNRKHLQVQEIRHQTKPNEFKNDICVCINEAYESSERCTVNIHIKILNKQCKCHPNHPRPRKTLKIPDQMLSLDSMHERNDILETALDDLFEETAIQSQKQNRTCDKLFE